MAVFTVTCLGKTLPLSAWGIDLVSLNRVNLGIDTLKMRVRQDVLTSAPVFPYGTEISFRKDGVQFFFGVVIKLPKVGRAQEEYQEYEVAGPWWYLENIVYQQRRIAYGIADPSSPTFFDSSTITLNGSYSGTPPTLSTFSIATQITAVLNFALTIGAKLHIGIIGIGTVPPISQVRDITVAEIIRQQLKWVPDSCSWFDYSTEIPTLHIRRRSVLNQVTVDLTAKTMLEEFEVTSREDLQVNGVLFFFEQAITVDGQQMLAFATSVAGAGGGSIGSIIYTFTLAGINSDTPEPIPYGLAADYYGAVSVLQYEGQLVLREAEIGFQINLGDTLNFTNGQTDWATMKALVQQIEFDFQLGRTTVEFGPPQQLGPQDFIGLMLASRQTKIPPPPPPPPPDPNKPPLPPYYPPRPFPPNGDGTPFPTIELELCDGSTVHVVGSP